MTSIKKVINLKSDAITIEHLEIQILEVYKLSNNKSNKTDGSAKEQETTMITFSGKCYNCGKEGHRANVFPDKKKGKGPGKGGGCGNGNKGWGHRAGFTGKCRKCERVGDKDDDCWD